jgi:hypothetical protein
VTGELSLGSADGEAALNARRLGPEEVVVTLSDRELSASARVY